jgi:flagellar biosynthesis chaperone FliJ
VEGVEKKWHAILAQKHWERINLAESRKYDKHNDELRVLEYLD